MLQKIAVAIVLSAAVVVLGLSLSSRNNATWPSQPAWTQGRQTPASKIVAFNASLSFRDTLAQAVEFVLKEHSPISPLTTLVRYQGSARTFASGRFTSKRKLTKTIVSGLGEPDPEPGTSWGRALELVIETMPESGPVILVFATDGFSELASDRDQEKIAKAMATLQRHATRVSVVFVGVDSHNTDELSKLFKNYGVSCRIVTADQLRAGAQ